VKMTLEAVEKYKVNILGQIPTQFRMLWNHPEYGRYDLSSLRFVAYAGRRWTWNFSKNSRPWRLLAAPVSA